MPLAVLLAGLPALQVVTLPPLLAEDRPQGGVGEGVAAEDGNMPGSTLVLGAHFVHLSISSWYPSEAEMS